MGPELVVPMNPVGHCGPRLSEARKVVLPGALFLEAAEKALNDSVLLRSVGSDELLRETLVFAGRPEALTLGASNAAPHLRATERRRDPCSLIISSCRYCDAEAAARHRSRMRLNPAWPLDVVSRPRPRSNAPLGLSLLARSMQRGVSGSIKDDGEQEEKWERH